MPRCGIPAHSGAGRGIKSDVCASKRTGSALSGERKGDYGEVETGGLENNAGINGKDFI